MSTKSNHHTYVCVWLAISTLSCGAATSEETDEGTTIDERHEQAAHILSAHGVDPSSVSFQGNEVIIEGDMVMDLEALLALEPQAQVDKGYHYSFFPVGLAAASRVRLMFDPALPQAWRTAFRSAAAEWSKLAGIDIREDNNTFTTFLEVHYYRFNFLFPDTDTFARGWLPPWEEGSAGLVKIGKVAVNAGYVGSCFTGTDAAAQRLKTAMHEIGHTLGLKHPTEGFHIAGTASGTGYSTVMAQGCSAMTALQADDVASADRLY